ncbi:hypothetical protein BGX33_006275 [Mortierella sp. NVP41]|nr:hypothetical protein BGX33_006275 [Mortierella sp. NVP41]
MSAASPRQVHVPVRMATLPVVQPLDTSAVWMYRPCMIVLESVLPLYPMSSARQLCSSGAGFKPTDEQPCTDGPCLVRDGNELCTPPEPDDCACPEKKDICGKVFDEKCGFDNETLYGYQAVGSKPEPIEECKEYPVPPQCTCKDPISFCGSKFDPECTEAFGIEIDPKAIYTCSGAGAIPQKGQECRSNEQRRVLHSSAHYKDNHYYYHYYHYDENYNFEDNHHYHYDDNYHTSDNNHYYHYKDNHQDYDDSLHMCSGDDRNHHKPPSGKCLDGEQVVLYTCGGRRQSWVMTPDFQIRNGLSEWCLAVQLTPTTDTINYPISNVVVEPCDANNRKLKWTIQDKVQIRNDYYGTCIDVYQGRLVDGQRIIAWPCHNKAQGNQRWTLPSTWTCYDDEQHELIGAPPRCTSATVDQLGIGNNLCLTVQTPLTPTAQTSWVVYQRCSGFASQTWRMEDGQIILNVTPPGVTGPICLTSNSNIPPAADPVAYADIYASRCAGITEQRWFFDGTWMRPEYRRQCLGSYGATAVNARAQTQP